MYVIDCLPHKWNNGTSLKYEISCWQCANQDIHIFHLFKFLRARVIEWNCKAQNRNLRITNCYALRFFALCFVYFFTSFLFFSWRFGTSIIVRKSLLKYIIIIIVVRSRNSTDPKSHFCSLEVWNKMRPPFPFFKIKTPSNLHKFDPHSYSSESKYQVIYIFLFASQLKRLCEVNWGG